ncbi:hypothetical protein [Saccharothrix texasensis]|uniref:hypothetical protein n=1 Tax=Saccharothrix texasensis TaxID=103734 RepID=UPI0011CEAB19|nr:hypothetical protein [Saccharothrix texasensis]
MKIADKFGPALEMVALAMFLGGVHDPWVLVAVRGAAIFFRVASIVVRAFFDTTLNRNRGRAAWVLDVLAVGCAAASLTTITYSHQSIVLKIAAAVLHGISWALRRRR